MPNEEASFLQDIPKDSTTPDFLNEPLPITTESDEGGTPAKENDPQGNRRERREQARRWENRLTEREKDLIAREARLEAVAELQAKSAPQEVPVEWLQMFGDKPETRQAWDLQQRLMKNELQSFKDEMRNEMLAEQRASVEEEREAEDELSSILESVEDKYNLDFSSSRERNKYLDALAKISHKNENGEVDGYGDPDAAYELYAQSQKSPTAQKQKDLAARSSAPTTDAPAPQGQDDAIRAYLRSEGINV